MQQTPPEGHYVLGTHIALRIECYRDKKGDLDMKAQQKNHPISKSLHQSLVRAHVIQRISKKLFSIMGLIYLSSRD